MKNQVYRIIVMGMGFFVSLIMVSDVNAQMMQRQNNLDIKPTPTKNPERLNSGVTAFCENITSYKAKYIARITERERNRNGLKTQRSSVLGESRTERNENLYENREMADNRRQELYTSLLEKASTDEQRKAVEEYKSNVENAVESRKIAIDETITTFRSEIDKMVSDRDINISKYIDQYKISVEEAFEKSENSCNGENPSIPNIRTTLNKELKSANEKLRLNLSQIDKIKTKMEDLNETRKDSIEKAISEFKKTIREETEKLRSILELK